MIRKIVIIGYTVRTIFVFQGKWTLASYTLRKKYIQSRGRLVYILILHSKKKKNKERKD